MINILKNTSDWDSSLEITFRNAFAADIANKIPAVKALPLTEIFLEIFDICSHNEGQFLESIYLYLDSPNVTDELYTMSRNALNFYDTYKHHLTSNVARDRMLEQQREVFNLPEEIVVTRIEQKNDPLGFNDAQKQIIDDIIEASSCTIDFEALTDAVTLSCGHSINLASAIDIHKNLNNLGKCEEVSPCSTCRVEVISFASNPLLRKVASKIDDIAKSFDDQNTTFVFQRGLVNELTDLLMCSKTKRLLSSAISFPRMSLNEEAVTIQSTPDYTMRELSRLVEKLNDSLNF
ncbi:MAG: hypothetical protein H0W50_09150 [Parachlamydiaceae bacterium]|nr:hypothetical protein [Parachlamydiaceae bacterium]